MNQILLRLPDGSNLEVASGSNVFDAIASVNESLAKKSVAAKLNGELIDLQSPLMVGGDFEAVTLKSPEGLTLLRHSTAHVMADAVQRLFPEAKVTIGPSIEHGFYYDFDVEKPFTTEDLEKIEGEMKKIIGANLPFQREVISREVALKLFEELGETYKVELIQDLPEDEELRLYRHGDWVDLCRGPHLPRTGLVKSFKLTQVAGAYWRGLECNPMLQRIYGTAFPDPKALRKHLDWLEEVKKRDHRKLGKQLDYFSMDEEVGGGLVLWHPKGARIRSLIEQFWRDAHFEHDYELLYTPHIARTVLWDTSGHTDFYKENMYSGIDVDGAEYLIKPMNCPFHVKVFRSKLRSYRDLPLRYAEMGTVYRYERSGVLHGLLRVRGFTQDDAHIFCTIKDMDQEIRSTLDFCLYILRTFGFEEFDIYLATRPEKFIGHPEVWELAEQALKTALDASNQDYQIDPGEGTFYGPKIDIKIRDQLGRSWQCSTIQVDFNLPERFDLKYTDSSGSLERPIMLHRALMGSLERFFGILLEHYGGALPLWMAPVQAVVLSLTDRHADFACEVVKTLKAAGYRVELDDRNEKLGYKIREAQLNKVPYMLVIGDKEVEERGVSPRRRSGENLGLLPLDEFIAKMAEESAIPCGGEMRYVKEPSIG